MLVGIHAIPKIRVIVCSQLSVIGKTTKRILFEHAGRVGTYIMKYLGLANEESAVDRSIAAGLFLKARDLAALMLNDPELAFRMDRGKRNGIVARSMDL